MIAEALERASHPVEQATAHAAASAGSHGTEIPELANWISLINHRLADSAFVAWLHHWEDLAFSLLVGLMLCAISWLYARKPSMVPRGPQNLLELLVESIDQSVQGILGKAGRRYTPFIGTLFLYILLMNLSVLIPGMKSATSRLNTTLGLALVVFCHVQWIGIKSRGFLKYLDHLAGSPRDAVGWTLIPLMFPIHLLGEIVKPMSLSLRLGFNVFAEDVLLAVLVGLGLSAGLLLHLPVGLPLQTFVVPLVLIFSTVQALVFSLLSTIYIALLLPHEAHH